MMSVLLLQLSIEVVRQLAFAVPVAFAWEFERDIAWWTVDRRFEDAALMITGLAAGAISILMWPHTFTDERPLLELAALASPILTAFLLNRTGAILRGLGQQPPMLFDLRSGMIVAAGMTVSRLAMM